MRFELQPHRGIYFFEEEEHGKKTIPAYRRPEYNAGYALYEFSDAHSECSHSGGSHPWSNIQSWHCTSFWWHAKFEYQGQQERETSLQTEEALLHASARSGVQHYH